MIFVVAALLSNQLLTTAESYETCLIVLFVNLFTNQKCNWARARFSINGVPGSTGKPRVCIVRVPNFSQSANLPKIKYF